MLRQTILERFLGTCLVIKVYENNTRYMYLLSTTSHELMKCGQYGIQNKCLKAVYMYKLFFILLIFSTKLCITRYALYVHGNTLL